jgi:hypothetical protein
MSGENESAGGPRYKFRTKDHPEANGRQAEHGDLQWVLKFPLDGGGTLLLEIGANAMQSFVSILDQARKDGNFLPQKVERED